MVPPGEESSLAPRATTTVVADALRDAIIRGELPAGTPLRQDRIAARFQVSHIPVREALRQLVSEGLAVQVHNRGVAVSALSADEAAELTEYRCLLEGQLTRWAVPVLSAADLAEMERLQDALDRTDAVEEMMRLNAAFHAALYGPAGRPFFLKSVAQVRVNLGRYWRLAWQELGQKPRSQDEHRRILQACRACQAEEAGALVEHHIRSFGLRIADYLRRQGGGMARR